MSDLARSQTRFGAFQLHTECQHCGERLPVNGPLRRLPCGACGRENRIDLDVITALLARFEEAWQELTEGETQGGLLSRDTAGRPFTWQYTQGSPRCLRCGVALGAAAIASDGSISCAACGEETPVSPVPAWLKITVPSAVRVIGAQPSVGVGSGVSPVAIDCPGCGRGLTLEGAHARITPCGYCGQEIFLPDAAWQALHPPALVQDWYVQFEGPTAEELRRAASLKSALRAGEDRRRSRKHAEARASLRTRWMLGLLATSSLLLAIALLLQQR